MGGSSSGLGSKSHNMESSLDDLGMYALWMWKHNVGSFTRFVGNYQLCPSTRV
ncbi:hypothetical protein CRYUN_Cryun10bG0056200 [Craigia yunnanensis]